MLFPFFQPAVNPLKSGHLHLALYLEAENAFCFWFKKKKVKCHIQCAMSIEYKL